MLKCFSFSIFSWLFSGRHQYRTTPGLKLRAESYVQFDPRWKNRISAWWSNHVFEEIFPSLTMGPSIYLESWCHSGAYICSWSLCHFHESPRSLPPDQILMIYAPRINTQTGSKLSCICRGQADKGKPVYFPTNERYGFDLPFWVTHYFITFFLMETTESNVHPLELILLRLAILSHSIEVRRGGGGGGDYISSNQMHDIIMNLPSTSLAAIEEVVFHTAKRIQTSVHNCHICRIRTKLQLGKCLLQFTGLYTWILTRHEREISQQKTYTVLSSVSF